MLDFHTCGFGFFSGNGAGDIADALYCILFPSFPSQQQYIAILNGLSRNYENEFRILNNA